MNCLFFRERKDRYSFRLHQIFMNNLLLIADYKVNKIITKSF